MAGLATTFASDILKLIFQAVAIANLADNAAASPATNLYLSLHTGDPGVGGSQTTNEIGYTGYARVAILRTSGGWTVLSNVVNPVANVDFGEMTAGVGGTVTFAGVGTGSAGAGKMLISGAVSPTIAVANGVTPRIKSTSTITFS